MGMKNNRADCSALLFSHHPQAKNTHAQYGTVACSGHADSCLHWQGRAYCDLPHTSFPRSCQFGDRILDRKLLFDVFFHALDKNLGLIISEPIRGCTVQAANTAGNSFFPLFRSRFRLHSFQDFRTLSKNSSLHSFRQS